MLDTIRFWIQRTTTKLGLTWLGASLGLVGFVFANPSGEALPSPKFAPTMPEAFAGYAIALGGVVVWAIVRMVRKREPERMRSDESTYRRVEYRLRTIGDSIADLRRDHNNAFKELLGLRQDFSLANQSLGDVRERLAAVEATLGHLPCERGSKKDC